MEAIMIPLHEHQHNLRLCRRLAGKEWKSKCRAVKERVGTVHVAATTGARKAWYISTTLSPTTTTVCPPVVAGAQSTRTGCPRLYRDEGIDYEQVRTKQDVEQNCGKPPSTAATHEALVDMAMIS